MGALVQVGTYHDGRELNFDEVAVTFDIDGTPITPEDMFERDQAGQIRWPSPTMRNWAYKRAASLGAVTPNASLSEASVASSGVAPNRRLLSMIAVVIRWLCVACIAFSVGAILTELVSGGLPNASAGYVAGFVVGALLPALIAFVLLLVLARGRIRSSSSDGRALVLAMPRTRLMVIFAVLLVLSSAAVRSIRSPSTSDVVQSSSSQNGSAASSAAASSSPSEAASNSVASAAAVSPMNAVAAAPAPPTQPPVVQPVPYSIIKKEDLTFAGSTRYVWHVLVPNRATPEQLMATARAITEQAETESPFNEFSVGFYDYAQYVGFGYALGQVTFAPNGNWGDGATVSTGDYSAMSYSSDLPKKDWRQRLTPNEVKVWAAWEAEDAKEEARIDPNSMDTVDESHVDSAIAKKFGTSAARVKAITLKQAEWVGQ